MKTITTLFLTMAAVLFAGALGIRAHGQTAKFEGSTARIQARPAKDREIAVRRFDLAQEEIKRLSTMDDLNLPSVDFLQAVKYDAENLGLEVPTSNWQL